MNHHHSHLRPDGTTWPPVTPDPPPPPGYVDPLRALEDPVDPDAGAPGEQDGQDGQDADGRPAETRPDGG